MSLSAEQLAEPTPEVMNSPQVNEGEMFLVINGRPNYAPTPLSPWELKTLDAQGRVVPYYERSLERFDTLIQAQRGQQPDWLLDAAHTSLMSLHTSRCDRNYEAYQEHLRLTAGLTLRPEVTALIQSAMHGTADQKDLLTLFSYKAGFPSLSLAKESHPGNWDTTQMDLATENATDEHDANAVWPQGPKELSYTYYRPVPEDARQPKGLVIVRKRTVARFRDGSVVKKRSTFILRLDQQLPDGLQEVADMFTAAPPTELDRDTLKREIVRKLLATGHEDRAKQFLARINTSQFAPGYGERVGQRLAMSSEYLEAGIDQQASWLYPVASSYYVREGKRNLPLNERVGALSHKKYYTAQVGSKALLLAA